MKVYLAILLLISAMLSINGQSPEITKDPKPLIDAGSAAKSAFDAHGGARLKSIKTLVIKGGVDVTVQAQSLPGAFSTVISGDKYVLDIQTAFQSIKQTFDGQNTVSSINGITLPPVTSLGFPLLPRLGDAGFVVSSLPDGKKKGKG